MLFFPAVYSCTYNFLTLVDLLLWLVFFILPVPWTHTEPHKEKCILRFLFYIFLTLFVSLTPCRFSSPPPSPLTYCFLMYSSPVLTYYTEWGCGVIQKRKIVTGRRKLCAFVYASDSSIRFSLLTSGSPKSYNPMMTTPIHKKSSLVELD